MYKTLIILTAAAAIAGCSTTRERDRVVSVVSPVAVTVPQQTTRQAQPVVRQAPTRMASQAAADPSISSLKPGSAYVGSFPEADRRAACDRLDYQQGTRAYRDCLEGNFEENPYFAQAGN